MVPTCFDGAAKSAFHCVRKAASLAGFNKQGAEFVVPLTPANAAITFPLLSTCTRTTTLRSSDLDNLAAPWELKALFYLLNYNSC